MGKDIDKPDRAATDGPEQRIFTTPLSVETRAGDDEAGAEVSELVGFAALYNVETVIGGWFREVIAPGAFDRALAENQDVRALWNHDPNFILGRTKNGTLKLDAQPAGLSIRIDPLRSSLTDSFVASIARGDVDEMSFAFRVNGSEGEKWEDPENYGDLPLRTLLDLDVYDVAPVTYPAYSNTQISARAASEYSARAIPETKHDDASGPTGANRSNANALALRKRRAQTN
jgi:HK97 family phage prohead protease